MAVDRPKLAVPSDLPGQIADLQAEFQHIADHHPWVCLAVPPLRPEFGIPEVGEAFGPPAPTLGSPGVRPPTDSRLLPVVENVQDLTFTAHRLLLQVLEGPNQIPANVQQEIRELDQECPGHGYGWIRWLWDAAVIHHVYRIENYPQVAATALRALRRYCLAANPRAAGHPDGPRDQGGTGQENAAGEAAGTAESEPTGEAGDGDERRSAPRPDGPEPPRWLWLNGNRYPIGNPRSRRSWRLLAFFWDRNSATYEDLQGPPPNGPGEPEKPWPDPVGDSAIGSAVNRFNNEAPSALLWRLKTGGRCVYRESRENPAM